MVTGPLLVFVILNTLSGGSCFGADDMLRLTWAARDCIVVMKGMGPFVLLLLLSLGILMFFPKFLLPSLPLAPFDIGLVK